MVAQIAGRQVVDLATSAGRSLRRLPYILRILLENVERTAGADAPRARSDLLAWLEHGRSDAEIPFLPSRVLMHDTTCGPALVDIAAMRWAVAEAGGDPGRLAPVLPVDVSTDHSLAVDSFGGEGAMARNMGNELCRNDERYRFMKWATKALPGVQVHPPGTGIMHTLNLEALATCVTTERRDGSEWLVPDTLIGTDSHTPMINGIGVLGWGVGGLEAESVMFGMPVMLRIPDVVGVRLIGHPRGGVLGTDLALAVTEGLRQIDLADRYVEFFGPGMPFLSAGDRAVIANMAPEFGANTGLFPIDERTLAYLRATGRSAGHVALVEAYARAQQLWFDPAEEPRFTEVVEFDLGAVGVSLAGPRRPQDRLPAGESAAATQKLLAARDSGSPIPAGPNDGAVAIAAITSCTNTSDPRLLIAAGLLARKARAFGLKPPVWCKTSLAPGSPTAASLLRRAGLLEDLEALGFGIVGYGCTTCIGNSGPLTPGVKDAIEMRGVLPVAVLSGNRNFPGRVHPQLEAGFLASPPMVIAFALAGDVLRDITADPIGTSLDGRKVRLSDLWPTGEEIDRVLAEAADPADYGRDYALAEASAEWAALDAPEAALFPWEESSTYIRRPPFASLSERSRLGSYVAHPLLVVGDDITTDHISPAGQIPRDSAAATHLVARGSDPADLNVFASRRGNWEVMVRGLFTNRSVLNLLDPDCPPGSALVDGVTLPLWDAAERYRETGRSVVIVAGERYGMGSSRDWAAKGVALLGVRAVLASSFERIHRSNLIGMGVLPLKLPAGLGPAALSLTAGSLIEIDAIPEYLGPRSDVSVRVRNPTRAPLNLTATVAVETAQEVNALRAGGLLPMIVERALA